MMAIRAPRDWLNARQVFSMLLMTTLVSTILLATAAVATLQRVADEHPRRYLARVLFERIASEADRPDADAIKIDGSVLRLMDVDEVEAEGWGSLLDDARDDADGIAIGVAGDRYAAGMLRGDHFVLLPEYGRSISLQAMLLVAALVVATTAIFIAVYLAMRQLTKPFDILREGVDHVESGDLDHRIPIEHTYGEFRMLAQAFNRMVERLQHIHEARRHMLLAIPHELFSPLARLRVRKDLITDVELRDKIGGDIRATEDMLNAILATERRDVGENMVEPITIKPFVDEVIGPYVESGAEISFENRLRQDVFFGEPFSLSVLLKNLVTNAIRYGRERPISVRLLREGEDDQTLVIQVQDRGIGVAKDQIPFMVEPFWRADESRRRKSGGYGLGLYLCRTIAENFGGSIRIDSELDVGTTISIVLPGALTPDALSNEAEADGVRT